jgi:hypothetical protein
MQAAGLLVHGTPAPRANRASDNQRGPAQIHLALIGG